MSTPAALAWSATRLAQVTQGQWSTEPLDLQSPRIITNTKLLQAGDVFLALRGERFDAHDFLAQAKEAGAVAAIVSRRVDVDLPQLVVADTRLALGALGTAQRQALPQLRVAALTGSSGKTTVKEMLGSILSLSAQTLMTRGNLNNDLGVPMMLLELRADHQCAVMELGANHVGEIAYTSGLVAPQVAGVLNIGTAHMGEFGGREGIARAKSEIYGSLAADAVAIVPTESDFAEILEAAAAGHPQLRFGAGGDVFATEIDVQAASSRFVLHTPAGQARVDLPFAGRHNVDNALAAAAFATALDVPLTQIVAGLENCQGVKGRLQFSQHQTSTGDHYTIIDDTYNANPHAVRAAAQVLVAQQGIRVLLLGDIAELGDAAVSEHTTLGADLAMLPIDQVYAVGQYAAHTIDGYNTALPASAGRAAGKAFLDKPSLMQALRQDLAAYRGQPVTLLFKGSRSATMETLITDLLENR